MSDIERRRLLVAVAAAGAAIPVVAACGGDDSTSPGSGTETEDSSAPEATPTPTEEESESPTPEETSQGGGNALGKTSDIPVGGGKVFAEQKVVVTQPQAGDFKGFSAICTHRGCPVKDVSGGTINCPCHGSKYKIADGSVSNGPATKGLAAANIKVEGDSITLA